MKTPPMSPSSLQVLLQAFNFVEWLRATRMCAFTEYGPICSLSHLHLTLWKLQYKALLAFSGMIGMLALCFKGCLAMFTFKHECVVAVLWLCCDCATEDVCGERKREKEHRECRALLIWPMLSFKYGILLTIYS